MNFLVRMLWSLFVFSLSLACTRNPGSTQSSSEISRELIPPSRQINSLQEKFNSDPRHQLSASDLKALSDSGIDTASLKGWVRK
ncbi:MAG: hypothetical protein C5B49_10525 [Bdellovibrio sp.]|nr:MAG: hypothetical protein C5B49_10525 [Bdellovibrio sp.]